MFGCVKGRPQKENDKRHDIGIYKASREKPKCSKSLPQQNSPMEKGMSFIDHSSFSNLLKFPYLLHFGLLENFLIKYR